MNIDKIDKEIERLQKLKREKRSRSMIKCALCKKRTGISKLTYYQPWYFHEEGHNSYSMDTCDMHWKCPKCGKYNREYENNDRTYLASVSRFTVELVRILTVRYICRLVRIGLNREECIRRMRVE
jgi:hypothetical protein